MKISSASKKVLASALSAAMVVAFAPAAAFGAIDNGTSVTVKYDVNGGKIADEHIGSIPSDTVSVAGGKVTLSSEYGTLTNSSDKLTKNGFSFKGWFFDANGDGQYTTGDNSGDVMVSSNELDVSGEAISGTEVTLKAAYNEPTLTPSLVATSISGSMVVDTSSLKATGLTSATQYTAKLAFPDGSTVVNAVAAKSGTEASSDGFSFQLTDAQKKAMTAGEYTFSVSDASNGVVATEKVKVVTVKLSNGAGYGTFDSSAVTEFLVAAGTDNVAYSNLSQPANSAASDGYSCTGYTDGKTVYSSGNITVKKDTTLTAVYNNPQVGAVSFGETTVFTGSDKGAGTLVFTCANLVAGSTTARYDATVTGPNGFTKVVKNIDERSENTLTFGADWESDSAVTTKLEAGTYTVTVACVAKKDQELTEAQAAQKIDTKSVTLAAVTYDLGAGKWVKDATGERTQPASLPTLVVEGTALNTGFTVPTTSDVDADDELQSFDYATVNGKKSSALKITDTASASGVAVAVVYKTDKIAAPAVAFAPNAADATKYDMTVTAAAGTKVQYKIGSGNYAYVPDNGVVTLSATDASVTVRAETADAKATKSKEVTYTSATTTAGSLGAFATTVANAETSTSAKNAPVRYGDALKTLKADAVAAATAKGYATSKEWGELELATERDILSKAIAVETENLTALSELKLSADGKTYTYVSEADSAAAAAALEQVLADFDGLTGKDKSKYKAKSTTNGTTPVTDSAADYIAAITYAVTSAHKTTVAAADVDAAKAVTEQLKAATDATAAQAAIDAYQKLTDAQKKLVDTDALAAAHKVVDDQAKKDAEDAAKKAAEELVKAQDKAAVAGITGKTVKAKSKKKVTAKLAGATSESGAVVTFSKKSGNAKVKVAKGGKITVKKGLKKGKKYTVKVTATCGSATKVVKVVVKVVK